ncbi:MAG: class I SAM-dependent methyltransferase [Hyphomicrobiales bacterium]|nr:class I SAM-dependent methyltransferase [Hyphomicrobiales bacterium]
MNSRQDSVALSGSYKKSELRRKSSPRFWNWIAKGYAKKPVADEATYQKKLAITRDYLRPDMKLMEFGCGTGSTALAHAPHVQHIHAIDFSGKMIEIARGKAQAAGVGNVRFSQSGIEEFEAPDASFDVILGLNIVHLLENRKAATAKVHRLLKPGGVFISSTVCLADMRTLFKYIAPAGRMLRLLPYVSILSKSELVRELTGAGFTIDVDWEPDRKEDASKVAFIVAKKMS